MTCKNLQVNETIQKGLPCKRDGQTLKRPLQLWRHANSGRNRTGNVITLTQQSLLTSRTSM